MKSRVGCLRGRYKIPRPVQNFLEWDSRSTNWGGLQPDAVTTARFSDVQMSYSQMDKQMLAGDSPETEVDSRARPGGFGGPRFWRLLGFYLGVPSAVAIFGALNNWSLLEEAGYGRQEPA